MNKKSNELDKVVLELLDKVEEKKKEIGTLERPSWITNCSFGWTNTGNAVDRINIQVVRSIEELTEIMSFLIVRRESWEKSIKQLKLKDIEFKWLGFTFEEWETDIKTRVNQLEIKTKRDELSVLEKRVNALVSVEQRREFEIKKLAAELK